MKRYPAEQMQCLAARLATAVGVPDEDAEIFSRSLVDADLQGTSTHGMSRLSIYLQRLSKGLISPRAELKVDRGFGSVLALDANNGLGQVQATRTLDLMKSLAQQNGVAAATIRNSQHFGALSYYCNRAADDHLILLAMSNCEPAMSPAGGYEAFFGTNPIAASFPTGKGFHVKVDLATSIVARGNIIAAQKKGQPIPQGWALDVNGEPTTDAQQALLGTVLTMAGHKGYALALMIETFSSVLSGAAIGSDIGSMYKNMDRKQDVGHFFCLFDIRAFMEPAEFLRRIDETIDRLKAGKRRPGVEEILIPGERSASNYARNLQQGIPISDETVAELERWCRDLNVKFECTEVKSK
jgi:LDH2 family malate/lactate/ureidoglycolate dehydrogenase